MKKRIFSFILAALMCMSLCAGAFAAGGEPDLKDAAWEVALNLNDAAGVVVSVEGEISGDVTGPGSGGNHPVAISSTDAIYADGNRFSDTKYYHNNSISERHLASMYPETGVYRIYEDVEEGTAVYEHYDEAAADIFNDPTTPTATHLAALGDDLLGAQENDGVFTYELAGDDLRDLITACCPEIIKGCELDWSQISAQMNTEPRYGFVVYIDLSSPSLAEAILGGLQGAQSVENAALDISISVKAMDEDDNGYEDYHFTKESFDQLAHEDAIEYAEAEGECPAAPSLADMVWALFEPEWTEAAETESAKDTLRAQMNGQAPAEEEEAPVEEPGE